MTDMMCKVGNCIHNEKGYCLCSEKVTIDEAGRCELKQRAYSVKYNFSNDDIRSTFKEYIKH